MSLVFIVLKNAATNTVKKVVTFLEQVFLSQNVEMPDVIRSTNHSFPDRGTPLNVQ